jgi:uncharacterized protein YdaU (DUF1376 family)
MSLEEEGAYRRAMNYCWLSGSLPADTAKLARLIGKGCSPEVAETVKQMFVEQNGVLIHERLDKEREKQKDWREKSSLAGKKSAEKRKAKKGITVKHPGNQTSTTLQPKLNQNPTLHSSSPSSSSFPSSTSSSSPTPSSTPFSSAEKNTNEYRPPAAGVDIEKKEKKKETKLQIEKVPLPWASEDFAALWQKWKDFREREFGKYFRSADSELGQLYRLQKISEGIEANAIAIIEQSMGNQWQGLFEILTGNYKTEQAKSKIPFWRKTVNSE